VGLQFRDTIRNAELDAIESTGGTSCALRVYTGAKPADCTQPNSGTLLVTINLPADWMNNASGGSKTKLGTWSATASGGSGSTPGHFRLYNSQATLDGTTCIEQGDCPGDMSFDGTITAGQTVTIDTHTLTAGNP